MEFVECLIAGKSGKYLPYRLSIEAALSLIGPRPHLRIARYQSMLLCDFWCDETCNNLEAFVKYCAEALNYADSKFLLFHQNGTPVSYTAYKEFLLEHLGDHLSEEALFEIARA